MKQASAAAAHGRVFAGLRGKYTARPHDRDMNTVYVTAFSVHREFPLRPLSEPGCRLTEGRVESKLFFWRATVSRASLNPALFSSPTLVKFVFQNVQAYWLWIQREHRAVSFWLGSSVLVEALSFWCQAWCKIFASVRFRVSGGMHSQKERNYIKKKKKVQLCSK